MVAHVTTPNHRYMAFSLFIWLVYIATRKLQNQIAHSTWATGYRCYRANVDGEFELKN